MKGLLTRGNSVTDFSDWIEECIYNELRYEVWKEYYRVRDEAVRKEFMEGGPPAGIMNWSEGLVGLQTEQDYPYRTFAETAELWIIGRSEDGAADA